MVLHPLIGWGALGFYRSCDAENLVYILIRGPPIVCTWFSATRGRDMVLHPLIGWVHLVSIGPVMLKFGIYTN